MARFMRTGTLQFDRLDASGDGSSHSDAGGGDADAGARTAAPLRTSQFFAAGSSRVHDILATLPLTETRKGHVALANNAFADALARVRSGARDVAALTPLMRVSFVRAGVVRAVVAFVFAHEFATGERVDSIARRTRFLEQALDAAIAYVRTDVLVGTADAPQMLALGLLWVYERALRDGHVPTVSRLARVLVDVGGPRVHSLLP